MTGGVEQGSPAPSVGYLVPSRRTLLPLLPTSMTILQNFSTVSPSQSV